MQHPKITKEILCKIVHEANRRLSAETGDLTEVSWEDAGHEHHVSTRSQVDAVLANPEMTPEASHDTWMENKIGRGWVYGSIEDIERKVHPLLVPFHNLPKHFQAKDTLFIGIVRCLAPLLEDTES